MDTPKVRFFLTGEDGFVAGAAAFSETLPVGVDPAEVSEARFPDGGEEIWVSPTPTPGEPNAVEGETNLVINEIFYHPPEDRSGEFLELFNRGEAAIDVSGFRFSKASVSRSRTARSFRRAATWC